MKTKDLVTLLASLFLASCADGARTRPVINSVTTPTPNSGNQNYVPTKPTPIGGSETGVQDGEANPEVCPHKDEVSCQIWETMRGMGDGFYETAKPTSN